MLKELFMSFSGTWSRKFRDEFLCEVREGGGERERERGGGGERELNEKVWNGNFTS